MFFVDQQSTVRRLLVGTRWQKKTVLVTTGQK